MQNKGNAMTQLIPAEVIERKIFLIRGHKVMLDSDLATLYGVSTSRLNEQVRRNAKRFPADFMFQLTREEFDILISHFATSRWGGTRKLPLAFTEQGVAMLSSVLNSERAILVNIQIMRAFTKLREMLLTHKDLAKKIEEMERKYDRQFGEQGKKIKIIFEAIKRLLTPSEPPEEKRPKIGFHTKE